MILLNALGKLLYVPSMLFGMNTLAIVLMENQFSPLFLVGMLVVAVGISFGVEKWIPYLEDWNRVHNDRFRDSLHAIVNETISASAILALPFLATVLPNLDVWPVEWPLYIQLLAAIAIADFGITMTHYASHKVQFLWRFHAVHHSVKRMYGFNGLMKHPLHLIIELTAGTFPLFLIGIPQEVAFLLAFAVAIQLLLQHSNVDIWIGPLKYLLALAPVHRFHHLRWSGEGDVNFGLFTTIWDRLLGTARYDKHYSFSSEVLGIEDEADYPTSYFRQLIHPVLSQKSKVS